MRDGPYLQVVCDDCTDMIQIKISINGNDAHDKKIVDVILTRAGWLAKDGKDYCPFCKEEKL